MALGGMDFSDIDPNADTRPKPIPAGGYEVILTEITEARSKKGNGVNLSIVAQVLSGEYEGRKIYDNIYMADSKRSNKELQKSDAGFVRLSAIAHTLGNLAPRDASEWLNQPLGAIVGTESYPANDGSTRMKNTIVKYCTVSEAMEHDSSTGPDIDSVDGIPF